MTKKHFLKATTMWDSKVDRSSPGARSYLKLPEQGRKQNRQSAQNTAYGLACLAIKSDNSDNFIAKYIEGLSWYEKRHETRHSYGLASYKSEYRSLEGSDIKGILGNNILYSLYEERSLTTADKIELAQDILDNLTSTQNDTIHKLIMIKTLDALLGNTVQRDSMFRKSLDSFKTLISYAPLLKSNGNLKVRTDAEQSYGLKLPEEQGNEFFSLIYAEEKKMSIAFQEFQSTNQWEREQKARSLRKAKIDKVMEYINSYDQVILELTEQAEVEYGAYKLEREGNEEDIKLEA